MYKNILIPVDGSEASLLAASKAATLAKIFGSSVTAVYIVEPAPAPDISLGASFAYGQVQYFSTEMMIEANAALEATRKIMDKAAQPVTLMVRKGRTVHAGIMSMLENADTDLIIMYTHGRTGLAKLMHGSVTEKLLRETQVPVLVLH